MGIDFFEVQQHIFATRALSLAGFVVLLYDHLLTLSDEVELVWMKRPSMISTLFLINRYLVPLVIATDIFVMGGQARNISDTFCRGWLLGEAYLQIFAFAISHGLVALRVRVIWGGDNRLVNWALSIGFVLYLSTTLLVGTAAGLEVQATWGWNEFFDMCIGSRNHYLFWVWFPALLFETLTFGLMVTKAIHYTRQNFRMPATKLIYRDGAIYYFVIALCSVSNLIAMSSLPYTLTYISKYFSFAIVTAMSSKLILHLRALGREDEELSVEEYELRNTSIWTGQSPLTTPDRFTFSASTVGSKRHRWKDSRRTRAPSLPVVTIHIDHYDSSRWEIVSPVSPSSGNPLLMVPPQAGRISLWSNETLAV